MQIDEQVIANWFGQDVDASAASVALAVLDEQLQRRFGVPAYRTPGFTGVSIWKRRYAGERQPLHPELQHLIRTTTTQGRFECCPVLGVGVECCGSFQSIIPALYCLDMRWAYAAAAQAVIGGKQWRHEEREPGIGWRKRDDDVFSPDGKWIAGWCGWVPARYRVRFAAPEGWNHVGLLPVYVNGTWLWPSSLWSNEWTAWADHTEVRLALECGWHVEVMERLRCIDDVTTYDRPLRAWSEALMRMRDNLILGNVAKPGDDPAVGTGALYTVAIHRMILQSIGMLAAGPRTVTRTAESREGLPGHDLAEETYHEDERGTIVYEDYERSGLSRFLHPEIAAAVWAQTRTWLLRKRQTMAGECRSQAQRIDTGALILPREQVVGFGLDALYLTVDPKWPDDGREGCWRVKWHHEGPLPAPRNRNEMEAMGRG